MTLQEYFDEWKKDSQIDGSELGRESLNIPKLHHKWFRWFSEERLRLKRLVAVMDALRHKKTIFYTQGPDEETRRLGWALPPRGKILKTEAKQWIDSDRDVVEAGIAVAEQTETVAALEDIIKTIHNRSYHIGNAIRWEEFINGK